MRFLDKNNDRLQKDFFDARGFRTEDSMGSASPVDKSPIS